MFVRQQKIPSVSNRRDYIAREGKYQETAEHLLLFQDEFKDWEKLAEFESAQPRFTNQARELIIALPNEMANLSQDQLRDAVHRMVIKTEINEQPHAWAVHWNDAKTNLHLHLLFSERKPIEAEREPKRYRQDIWAKADGTMAHKKVDRHHIMHRKGDIQRDKNGEIKYKPAEISGFSEKDKKFKSKAWSESVKTSVHNALQELGYTVSSYNHDSPYLHEYHEGKGKNQTIKEIKLRNTDIREYNMVIDLLKKADAPQEHLKEIKRQALVAVQEPEIFTLFPTIIKMRDYLTEIKELKRSQALAPAQAPPQKTYVILPKEVASYQEKKPSIIVRAFERVRAFFSDLFGKKTPALSSPERNKALSDGLVKEINDGRPKLTPEQSLGAIQRSISRAANERSERIRVAERREQKVVRREPTFDREASRTAETKFRTAIELGTQYRAVGQRIVGVRENIKNYFRTRQENRTERKRIKEFETRTSKRIEHFKSIANQPRVSIISSSRNDQSGIDDIKHPNEYADRFKQTIRGSTKYADNLKQGFAGEVDKANYFERAISRKDDKALAGKERKGEDILERGILSALHQLDKAGREIGRTIEEPDHDLER